MNSPTLTKALKKLIRLNLESDPTDEDRPAVKNALRSLRLRVEWYGNQGRFRLVARKR